MTLSPLSDKLPTATPYSQDSEGNLEIKLNPLVDVVSEVLKLESELPHTAELAKVFNEKLSGSKEPGIYCHHVLSELARAFLENKADGKAALLQAAYVCTQLAVSYPE